MNLKMMKKLLLLTMLVLLPLSVYSATLTGARYKETAAKINAAAARMPSMTCDFTQTKHLAMLREKMVSKGKMYYRKPDKLRWEYVSPYKYTFILNGAKVSVANNKRNDVIDTRNNKLFKEIARIMMSTVTGRALSDTGDFTITINETAPTWDVTLVPKRKNIKQMFSKIILKFRRTDCQVQQIELYEKNGDRTEIKLQNIKTPSPVNDALFSIS